jgi:hypothetical protein
MGAACFVVLYANVYKHGWHWPTVALGVFMTTLMLSLAIPADRRTRRWVARYWLALATFCVLGIYRFVL